jgi:hypothetical protein
MLIDTCAMFMYKILCKGTNAKDKDQKSINR